MPGGSIALWRGLGKATGARAQETHRDGKGTAPSGSMAKGHVQEGRIQKLETIHESLDQ